jgi:hypothetical protein
MVSAGFELLMLATYLTFESPLSSLKLALMAALSFCTTARSSAMVFEARTLRMNCFTTNSQQAGRGGVLWRPTGAHTGGVGPRNGPDLRPLSKLRIEILASCGIRECVDSEVGRSAELLCPKCSVEGHTLAFRDAAKKYGASRLRQQLLGVTLIQSEDTVSVAGAARPQYAGQRPHLRIIIRIIAGQIPILC